MSRGEALGIEGPAKSQKAPLAWARGGGDAELATLNRSVYWATSQSETLAPGPNWGGGNEQSPLIRFRAKNRCRICPDPRSAWPMRA